MTAMSVMGYHQMKMAKQKKINSQKLGSIFLFLISSVLTYSFNIQMLWKCINLKKKISAF